MAWAQGYQKASDWAWELVYRSGKHYKLNLGEAELKFGSYTSAFYKDHSRKHQKNSSEVDKTFGLSEIALEKLNNISRTTSDLLLDRQWIVIKLK